ncbi:helix-turn-helix transcriptional regulator [Streptomyces gardneri]|uniref:Scr1 family TA system antitoxin-like transcriptional regulator n=1 Tax=Nocardia TaxID=1817 RepID=UPI001358121B|nr:MULTISPECIES: Scr1 family TA system antitoxin-like transcriptional regulator [Nocardia]MBF6164539.1 helix-turn-helix transcriptional regulator [Streptomyces gardneri]MBF6203936.1 helix-turn-helix transcriptional regulator [Streptomyces gardneri]UAK33945.1 Scr1 family TA system antitoxin-like transcriptional regulator [Nocardia asteroides]
MAPVSPTVARWELVLRLRELREQRGFDSAGFARRVGFTPANWSHVEKGRRVLTTETIGPVLELLEVEAEERAELLALLEASKQRGWWARSSALIGPELQRLYGMEYGAQSIRSYDSLVVPGLLQTEDYARALISADVMIRPVQVEQLVAIRMRRQERLRGADPVELTAVFGEGTLLQQTGGPDVLRGQLRYLADLIEELDTVEVRVIPFAATAGAVLGGSSFHLIDFAGEQLPTFGWVESAVFGGAVEDPDLVRDLRFAYLRAVDQSLSRLDSLALIRRYSGV